VLLEESSDDDDQIVIAKTAGFMEQQMQFKHESTKEIRRILKSVGEDNYEARHYEMITELRVRKMLAR